MAVKSLMKAVGDLPSRLLAVLCVGAALGCGRRRADFEPAPEGEESEGTPEGDGAVAFTVPLRSGELASGCAVAGGGGWWWWVVLLGWRRRGLWGVVLLAAVAGCKRVQPHERGRLAQPDMQLTPDPELTAGPEHALDYREGAAGGLGGGGGGCGCN